MPPDPRGRSELVRRSDEELIGLRQIASPWSVPPLSGQAALLDYLPGRPSGRPLAQFLQGAETKSFSRAGCDTGWFFSLHHQVQTEIALVHLPFGTELGNAKGACHQTEMAPETLMLIHYHDPVLGSLRDCTPRTNRLARRIPTVETRKRDAPAGNPGVRTAPDGDYSSPSCIPSRLMQHVAGDLTGVALNASFRIEMKAILFFHGKPHTISLLARSARVRAVLPPRIPKVGIF
jgi:hypothetical protein